MVLFVSLLSNASTYTFNPTKGVVFSWQYDDVMAFYSTSGETRVKHWVTRTLADGNNAELSGYGWSIVAGVHYYAYSPFNSSYYPTHPISALPVSFLAQSQKYNDDLSHLGAYDFMIGEFTSSTADAHVTFSHACSILRIEWEMAEQRTLQTLSLSSEEDDFVTGAAFNLPQQRLVATECSGKLSLNLNGIVVPKQKKLVAYMMLAPVNLTDKTIDVELTTSSGDILHAKLSGTNVIAGKTYPVMISDDKTYVEEPEESKSISDTHADITSLSAPSAYAPNFSIDTVNVFEVLENAIVGDVNEDGIVDVLDAIALNGYYINDKTAGLNKKVCDVNGDDVIDVLDVIAIRSKYLYGK